MDGKASILIANTGDTVIDLNRRDRADLVLAAVVHPSGGVALHDSSPASLWKRKLTTGTAVGLVDSNEPAAACCERGLRGERCHGGELASS